MPSSTSSSDRPGLRLTASDRPGVAQPVPERDIPDRPWRGIFFGALATFVILVAAWELYWRAYGVYPAVAGSKGLWATQRRRVADHHTIITGSSRMLFDIDLDTWQRFSGERPLQLAIEGTTPLPVLEDLLKDPAMRDKRVLIGVAPDLFFTGFAYVGENITYAQKETPAQRVAQWVSSHAVEPYLAFYDDDFALPTVLARQAWPVREGLGGTRVRKLRTSDLDRNTKMWSKVENDPEYRALARSIWAEDFAPMKPEQRAEMDKTVTAQIDRAVKIVEQLRARKCEVIFVRPPSVDDYLAFEDRDFPRASTWDVLLARTGAPGIHFKDHAELQGYELPEWSHLAAREKPRFTEALYKIVEKNFGK